MKKYSILIRVELEANDEVEAKEYAYNALENLDTVIRRAPFTLKLSLDEKSLTDLGEVS